MALATRMRGRAFALFVGAVLGCDGMWLVMSRVAMNDIYLTAATTAALWAFERHWSTEGRARTRWLFACATLFGVAVSIKWSALAPLVECAALVLLRSVVLRDASSRARATRALVCVAAFVALPLAIYLASYAPYFAQGHGLGEWVSLQRLIAKFHLQLESTHPSASPWWSWPLDLKPVWFFEHESGSEVRELYAMGNPAIFWLMVPAVLFVALRFARARSRADGIILLGFLGQWLPWALVGRLTFIQYFLPAVPFGVLAIASVIDDAAASLAKWRWSPAVAYVAICGATCAYFYPLWTALPVARATYDSSHWIWFDVWRGT
jgi:dolichyl-phosphate-mannose--protein O-mannosyl transferase